MLWLGPEGLLHKHRKLMPTQHERLFHGIGAATTCALWKPSRGGSAG